MDFIDREREQHALRELFERPGPSMAVLYGRRRVGKTFLLQNVFPPNHTFYFTAADATPSLNRRALLDAVSRWTGKEVRKQDFPTWRHVFELICDVGGHEPAAVVLDEYQFFQGGRDENVDLGAGGRLGEPGQQKAQGGALCPRPVRIDRPCDGEARFR
jgi:AAA+ ATPase superfamily predicted ATPase